MKKKVGMIAVLLCAGCLAAEPSVSLSAASQQQTVETQTQKKLSADNSLQILSLSSGTLSPEFTGSTVQYTAFVPNDVTSVSVTAKPVNAKATVESITGNENLQVGKNTIKVVVKAENEAIAVYTITVTRADAQEAQQADGAAAENTAADVQEAQPNAEATAQDDQQEEAKPQDVPVTAPAADGQEDEEEEEEISELESLREDYQKLLEKYEKQKSFFMNVIGTLTFAVSVLLVLMLNLFLGGRSRAKSEMGEDILQQIRQKEISAREQKKAREKTTTQRMEVLQRDIQPMKISPKNTQKTQEPKINKEEKRPLEHTEEPDDLEIIDFND